MTIDAVRRERRSIAFVQIKSAQVNMKIVQSSPCISFDEYYNEILEEIEDWYRQAGVYSHF